MDENSGLSLENGIFNRAFSGSFQGSYFRLHGSNQRVMPAFESMRGMSTLIYDKPTNLFEAVAVNDLGKVIEFVKSGSILQGDKEGKSPLHVAVENGYYEIVKFLLQAFPMYSVNIPDQSGNTPLHKAASIGHLEMIKALLERGAQVNTQDLTHGHTPLHGAAWKGYAESIELLCQVGRLPNLVDFGLFTPLHLAVQSGHNQTARNLIKYGADITAKNKFGDTPLHTAVRYGHAGVSRIIISVSTNVDHQNQNGDTALHIATALKRRKIVKLLIDAGAQLDVRNFQNESPVDVAVKKSHREILEIFSMATGNTINHKTVSFTPDIATESFPVHSKHVTIPEEMCQVVNQTLIKTTRNKSQTSHEKIKSKKISIVKAIFSRKKKDKVDKSVIKLKDDHVTSKPPMTPQKSILCTSKRKNSDQWAQYSAGQTMPSSRVYPVPGLMNTYQSQRGHLLFKDLAGNIKQGPIGYTPMPNATTSTCNCTQFSHTGTKNPYSFPQPKNVCLDHGYIDYHGPMSQYHDERLNTKTKERSKDKINEEGHPLIRSKSDESLNQSEHKSRMQEERLQEAKINQMRSSPVKGRRQNVVINNCNIRQDSVVKEFPKDRNPTKISFQAPQRNKDLKETCLSNQRSFDVMRTVIRPSPDGQTDSIASPSCEQPKLKVDWRAGKYRPEKVILPSSKV